MSGLNPNWRDNITVDSGFHPIISSVIFSNLTRTKGGASMDANTGEFVNTDDPSKDTYLVGKEPDSEGKPIPTEKISDADIMTKLPSIRRSFIEKTGGREGVSVGSWGTDKGIDIDASGADPVLSSALNKAKDRNEEAIWSTKKFRESGEAYDGDIPNPFYKKD